MKTIKREKKYRNLLYINVDRIPQLSQKKFQKTVKIAEKS